MQRQWDKISREHVLDALKRYDQNPDAYTKAKHTFLIHDGKSYPAKAIRGIAYQICFGEKISQDAFTGGKETARFLARLGFEVKTGGVGAKPVEVTLKPQPAKPRRGGRLDRAGQKNALEAILQKRFGVVLREKTFEWLRVPPSPGSFDQTYRRIYDSLCAHRGFKEFAKFGRRLQADFYVESLNLIIEYDENQHFSRARHIALQSYPVDLAVSFSVKDWMVWCEQINAADNQPPDRDEARAFYDAVRDIEIPRQGMQILRVRHGEVDWESVDAETKLVAMLRPFMPAHAQAAPPFAGDPLGWRKLEIEFQRIRLNYMKWFFYFTPPEVDPTGRCGPGESFRLFNAHNGTGFAVFPCGLGSVYVGGGKGCVRLPNTCFPPELCMTKETDMTKETKYLKESLDRLTKQAKVDMIARLRDGDSGATWRMLLEYWWLKLGLHEFAYDVTYQTDRSAEPLPPDVREAILNAMSRSMTASDLDAMCFAPADVEHFIHHRITWNRFACCSFDCGPIAVGRGGYVPYEEMAAARRKFFGSRDISSASEDDRRVLAKQALDGCCDFLMHYYEKPLCDMKQCGGFRENRNALATLIADTQNKLNSIIESEGLDMRMFTYVPQ